MKPNKKIQSIGIMVLVVASLPLTACSPAIQQFDPVAKSSASTLASSNFPAATPTPSTTAPTPTPSSTSQAVTAAQLSYAWLTGCLADGTDSVITRVTFNATGTVMTTSAGYQGAGCSGAPIINVAGTGTYTLGALSSAVAGATNVTFTISSVTGTPSSAIAALSLNLIGFCNYTSWQSNVAYSIPLNSACLSGIPNGSSVLAITGTTLYLGNATGTALDLTAPMTRQ